MWTLADELPVPFELTWVAELYFDGTPPPWDEPDHEGPDELPPPGTDPEEGDTPDDPKDRRGSARLVLV